MVTSRFAQNDVGVVLPLTKFVQCYQGFFLITSLKTPILGNAPQRFCAGCAGNIAVRRGLASSTTPPTITGQF